jgi:hypothetical protein
MYLNDDDFEKWVAKLPSFRIVPCEHNAVNIATVLPDFAPAKKETERLQILRKSHFSLWTAKATT